MLYITSISLELLCKLRKANVRIIFYIRFILKKHLLSVCFWYHFLSIRFSQLGHVLHFLYDWTLIWNYQKILRYLKNNLMFNISKILKYLLSVFKCLILATAVKCNNTVSRSSNTKKDKNVNFYGAIFRIYWPSITKRKLSDFYILLAKRIHIYWNIEIVASFPKTRKTFVLRLHEC